MSVAEIVHRILRLVRYFTDSIVFKFKLYSTVRFEVQTASRSLFPIEEASADDISNCSPGEMADKQRQSSPINNKREQAAESQRAIAFNEEKLAFHRALWVENKVQLFDVETSLQLDKPVQWLKDPKTGTRTPLRFGRSIDYRDDQCVGEIKYLWELGRHQFLVPMAVHIASTGDSAVRAVLEAHLSSWLQQNPIGMGIHWCSALEISLRLVSWSLVHSVLQYGGMKNGIFDLHIDTPELKSHIHTQTEFVVGNYSRFSSSNNHLIGELTGVWMVCNVFDLGAKGKRWRELALIELEREIEMQTHDDGVNKEQAIYYHLWCLEYFWLVWCVAKRYGHPVSELFEERVVAMYNFLSAMSSTVELPSQIGDADDGVVSRFSPDISENVYRSILDSIAYTLADKPEPASLVSSVYSKLFWYSRIVGESDVSSIVAIHRRGLEHPKTTQAFESGGYYVLQGMNCHLLFRAGPFGYLSTAAHSHADALSVTLAVAGQWWLVDPGTYTYHSSGEWRNYFRSTAAHSTLCVNQTNQSEIAGDFLWGKKTDAQVRQIEWNVIRSRQYVSSVSGSHAGYEDQGVVHERTIKCNGQNTFKVLDSVMVQDEASPTDLQLTFHFHPDINLKQLDTHQWLATRQNSDASLMIELPTQFCWTVISGSTKPIAGWYSDKYGVKASSPVLSGRTVVNGSDCKEPNLYTTLIVVRNTDGAAFSDGLVI